jgi:putative ABC transport system permease protein
MESEMDAEMRFHLEARAEDLKRDGVPRAEAMRRARIEFGGMEGVKEECRQARGGSFLDSVLQDLQFGGRMLRRNLGFTVAAVLTLAVGIGGASAVFSVVDRILFRSLPYPQDERLVFFGLLAPIEPSEFMLGASYVDFRKEAGPFEAITSMAPGTTACDLTEHNAVRLDCALVEQTFLSTLGIQPVLGRNFRLEEDQPKAPRVAILSHALWKTRFGGDAGIVEQTILVDGAATRIIGVLPANFEMPTGSTADILLPLALDELQQRQSSPGRVLRTFARLKPGVSVQEAVAQLHPWLEKAIAGAPAPFRKEIHLSVRTLRDRQTHDVRLASWLLFGSVLAFLLVACANVTNLVLARATGRQREAGMRAALGATRGRLIRQSLTENLLLGLLGALLGYGVAYGLLHWFVAIAPQGIPRLEQARLDARVALFTIVVTFICIALVGMLPALQSPGAEALNAREGRSSGRRLFRSAFISAQIAISLILVTAASLLVRSLWNLESARLGIRTENVLTEEISLAPYRYATREKQLAFFADLENKMKGMPGAMSVAVSDSLPPSGRMRSTILAAVEVAGRPPFSEGTGGSVAWRAVTSQYFAALGARIIRGRRFEENDLLPNQNVIILNETLAKELFQDGDPVGQQLRLFREQGPWRTVVGIAEDVKNDGLTEQAGPEFYLPWKNDPAEFPNSGYLIVRTDINPRGIAEWMRSKTKELDATLPVNIEAMTHRVSKLTARPRFNAMLLSLFAGMGVLLAAMGIHGVVRYVVAERTQEIGVRMALGATRLRILGLVLGGVGRWAVLGAAAGLVGAWISARLLRSLLFGVRTQDPMVYGMAFALLIGIVFGAAWIPARRAMRVDPMVALRYE